MRIGVDLGGTKIEGVVMDGAGAIVQRQRVGSPSHSYEAVVAAIGNLVGWLAVQADLPSSTPVGIGTPGSLQPASQTMKNCNSTVLNGQPLLRDLEVSLGRPVRLANDANCFALSEAVDGAGAGAQTVFGVILGTGVGGGIVVNGQLLSGPNSIAGEWGHTPLAYLRHAARPSDSGLSGTGLADRHCYCGRINCVETFLSGPGLALSAKQLLGVDLSTRAVFTEAQAVAVRDLYLEMLAAGFAQIINLLDPDVLVLGGGLSAQTLLYQRLPELLPRYLFSPDCRTKVLSPVHGDSSGVRGAAWLWPA